MFTSLLMLFVLTHEIIYVNNYFLKLTYHIQPAVYGIFSVLRLDEYVVELRKHHHKILPGSFHTVRMNPFVLY